MVEQQLRARFERQTREVALDAYERADESTQAGRRLVVFLETHWDSLAFRDDPDRDAAVILKKNDAVEARQLRRVPAQLLDWRDRLQRAQRHTAFVETLRHLRSGRGIAKRPVQMRTQIG
jgi:hypothetical protein